MSQTYHGIFSWYIAKNKAMPCGKTVAHGNPLFLYEGLKARDGTEVRVNHELDQR